MPRRQPAQKTAQITQAANSIQVVPPAYPFDDLIDDVGIAMPKRVDAEIMTHLRDCRVWRADDWDFVKVGVLVTESGDLDAPLAFVFQDMNAGSQTSWEQAIFKANAIACDPEMMDRMDVAHLDLRDRARPHSRRPVPGWMYGLRLSPIFDDPGELQAAGWEPIDWCPFCPIRMAVIVEQYARMQLRAGIDPKAIPFNLAGVCERDDGGGVRREHLLKRVGNPHTFSPITRVA